jgi:mannose-1-phosphate guanylyltransferase/phosphomannomutase
MKAMILAAGVGSRLDPLTRNVPKPMVPVVNRPVIEHIILKLKKHGFDEIYINVHYLGDVIAEYVGDGSKWGVSCTVVKEDQLWGDAGSMLRAREFFGDQTVLVVGGDDISDTNLTDLMAFHRKNKAVATIALSQVADTTQYGIVVTDAHGRISDFQEKPKRDEARSNQANAGIYVFEPEVYDIIPGDRQFGLGKNVLPHLVQSGKRVFGHLTDSYWKDVGGIEIYRQTNFDALAGLVKVDIPGECQGNGTWIGQGTEIATDAQIGSPVAIGNNVRIGVGVQITGNVVIGDGCVVEPGATLTNTILWTGAVVKKGTHLNGCLVGKGAEVHTNVAVFAGIVVEARRC